MAHSERRPTGIPGLDVVLDGGLLTSGSTSCKGPGAGKTILANPDVLLPCGDPGAGPLRDVARGIALSHVWPPRLRHIEHRAALLRVLAILKVRDDHYDGRMREFRIEDDGIRLVDTFAAEARVVSGSGMPGHVRLEGA